MTRTTIGALAAILLVAGAPLGAQEAVPTFQTPAASSSTRGFFVGLHLNGSGVEAEGLLEEIQNGGGLGFHLGYGFTPRFALFGELTGTALDETNLTGQPGGQTALAHLDVGVRYAFTSPTRRLVPSLELALTSRALVQEDVQFQDGVDDFGAAGGGITFGGGMQYYLTPRVALGTGFKWTVGEFDEVTRGNQSESGLGLEATSARFNITLTWYTRGGR